MTICEVTDSTSLRSLSGRRPEPALGLGQLRRADLLGAGTERGDRRHDGERRLPLPEALRLGRDDALGAHGLDPPARERRLDDRLEVVDVVDEAAVDRRERRVDVTRHGEVDEEDRAAAPGAQRRARSSAASRTKPGALVDVTTTSASRAGAEGRRDPTARAVEALGELLAVRGRAVRDRERSRAPRERRLRAVSSLILPAPTSTTLRAVEIVEHLLRERGGGRRDGGRALADRRLDAGSAARVQRLAEEAVEQRPGRARLERRPAPARGSRPRRERASRARPRRGRDAARRTRPPAGRAQVRARPHRSPASASRASLACASSSWSSSRAR